MSRKQSPFNKAAKAISSLIPLSPSNAISGLVEMNRDNVADDVNAAVDVMLIGKGVDNEKGDGMNVEQSMSSPIRSDHSSNKRSVDDDDEKTSESSNKKAKLSIDPLSESDVRQQLIMQKLRQSVESEFKCEPWCHRKGSKLYAVDRSVAHSLSGIMGRINKLELRLFNDNDEFRENVSMNEMMATESRRQLMKDVEYMRDTIDAVDWSTVRDPWSTVNQPVINLNTFCHLTLFNTRTDAGFVVKAAERIEQCSLVGRLSGMSLNECMHHCITLYETFLHYLICRPRVPYDSDCTSKGTVYQASLEHPAIHVLLS